MSYLKFSSPGFLKGYSRHITYIISSVFSAEFLRRYSRYNFSSYFFHLVLRENKFKYDQQIIMHSNILMSFSIRGFSHITFVVNDISYHFLLIFFPLGFKRVFNGVLRSFSAHICHIKVLLFSQKGLRSFFP